MILDLITVKFLSRLLTKPIYLFGGSGFVLCTGGVLAGCKALFDKWVNGVFVYRNPMILLAVFLFLLGVTFILMGLIAELIIRTYHESQAKPIYRVRETKNVAARPGALMCGIAGIVDPAGVDPEVLARMTATLAHRGPDDESYYRARRRRGRARVPAALDHRRRRRAGSRSRNEDGTVWLVLNGELYNFRELRAGLEARGHHFATRSDTEVLVHLYEERGVDCLERVNGMFAFALWDARRGVLFAARDRMGEKPLYWTERGGRLLFASELKALVAHPSCPTELDHDALERYLAHEYVPTPRSIVAGVHKLPAGHRLVWERGRTTVERWWDIPASPLLDHPDDELVGEFRARLSEAVRLRLVSDVPLGAFLSGGVDSSAVVAFMCEHGLAAQVKTFSIGFDEPSFDESEHARAVAKWFGTDHHEEVFTVASVLDVLPEVAAGLDEPFADASILPTYLLSRFARRVGDGRARRRRRRRAARRLPDLRRRGRGGALPGAARRPRARARAAREPAARLDRELQPRVQAEALPARRARADRRPPPDLARRVHARRAGRAADPRRRPAIRTPRPRRSTTTPRARARSTG